MCSEEAEQAGWEMRCGWDWKKRQAEKYMAKLLDGKIRLKDVPEKLRQDIRYTWTIHCTAFRADRGFSAEQYAEDIRFLRQEIQIAELDKKPRLQQELEYIYGRMYETLEELEQKKRNEKLRETIYRILEGRCRLYDVSEALRFDMECMWSIHLAAFLVDQNVSMERYKEDLSFLRMEISTAECRYEKQLKWELKRIYDKMCVFLQKPGTTDSLETYQRIGY